MANGNQLPEGFVLDAPEQTALPEGFVLDSEAPAQPEPEKGMFDFVTGESRMTDTMRNIGEIGNAPELNSLSVPAFKASLGLLSTGDTKSLKGILSAQFGDEVSFDEDEKGNTVVNLPSGQYALNTPGFSGQDFIRGAFDLAAFTPAGRAASIPAAIGKSAATEAAIEGTEASLGGEFTPTDVALAGGLGGAGKVAENVIGAGFRALKGSKADDVVEAGRDAGIPVLTSDIRQPETFAGKAIQQTGEKIPLAGTGGIRETQQATREEAVETVIDKYGEYSYGAIVDSLKSQKNKVKNAAGSVLQSTGNKLDDVGEIPLNNTFDAINDVSDELSKKGVIQSGGAVDDLDVLMDAITDGAQTFTSLKENRTAFREIVKGADKAERTQLTSRAKSLLSNVERAMTKDMDSYAKQNLTPQEFAKWKKANAVYAGEAQKLTKTKLKNVLDKGDVTPESVQTMLFSQKPSEVKTLYSSLSSEGRKNARSAIISKVVNDLSRRASGVTPNSFASEMKKYGLQTNSFFKGEEKKQLNGLLKVLNSTRRAQDASVTTPTGQSLYGGGTALALFTDPVSTIGAGGTLGGLSRLYESAPVRNALLRLDSVPKGSTQYEKALSEVFEVLNASAQSLRSGQEE